MMGFLMSAIINTHWKVWRSPIFSDNSLLPLAPYEHLPKDVVGISLT